MAGVPLSVASEAWKVAQVAIQRQGAVRPLNRMGRVLPYLLSARNRGAGSNFFDLTAILSRMQDPDFSEKYNKTVVGRFKDSFGEIRDDVAYCPSEGRKINETVASWSFDKTTSSVILELDNAQLSCTPETAGQYVADRFASLFQNGVSNLVADVENELYARDNAGDYLYIGNLPDKGLGVRAPFSEQLNLFRNPAMAYNDINPVSESQFLEDMMFANVGTNFMGFAGSRMRHYLSLKSISVGGDDGYDASQLSALNAARYMQSDLMTLQTVGVSDAFTVIQDGALQFVNRATFRGAKSFEGDKHKRYTLRDPYFNLEWDIIENTIICDKEIKRTIQATIDWALIGFPKCLDTQTPYRKGVNGVFGYIIGCGDTPVCSIPNFGTTVLGAQKPIIEACEPVVLCERPTCVMNLNLSLVQGNNGFAVLAGANAIAPAGAVSVTYTWVLDSDVVATGTSNTQLFAAGTIEQGSVIGVLALFLDANGDELCEADATQVVNLPCGTLRLSVGGVLYGNGDTVALGTIVGDKLEFAAMLNNISAVSCGTCDVTVTSATASEGTLVFVATPVTIAPGASRDVGLTTNSLAPAAYNYALTFVTDGCDEQLVISVNFEVGA